MRVIAGSAKAIRLKDAPQREVTRPLTDRAREALFSILMPILPEADFCDLFAGTGAVGIEALSRGAQRCDFVEQDARCVETIRENLVRTKLQHKGWIYQKDALSFCTSNHFTYDIIFAGPPYFSGMFEPVVRQIDAVAHTLLSPEGLLIVQAAPKEYTEVVLSSLRLYDKRKYGNVVFVFYDLGVHGKEKQ